MSIDGFSYTATHALNHASSLLLSLYFLFFFHELVVVNAVMRHSKSLFAVFLAFIT